ncbi:hypothetical protein [Streptomyces evansiae]|uniref:hypothetical protein n=1 Tax=Streptomyces evansiae TaxID=3075535 RepID=UPI002886309A|nr:hypothetical protein [Streptomyces sp. DSM 41859]MDT0425750.1 hypothetical protein [Streptomyces sp. DSM 41859]
MTARNSGSVVVPSPSASPRLLAATASPSPRRHSASARGSAPTPRCHSSATTS